MQANERGAIYASVQGYFRFSLTPAERRLIDKALDQIKAMREIHG